MFGSIKAKALITVPPIVLLVVATFFTFGYYVTQILGIPFSSSLELPVRMLGLLPLVFGFTFFIWVFRHRKPTDILISTYITFSKASKRSPLENTKRRTEPLIVQGPYRYVRHPLYTGVIFSVLGLWLLLDHSYLLVSGILLLLWFNFVVATFEEVELRAIFGEQYEKYSREVPKIIPFTKLRKKYPSGFC